MGLGDILGKIGVPLLGAVVSGPLDLGAGAIGLLTKVLGLADNSSREDIANAIQANPEAVLKLKQLENDYQQYLISVRLQMDQAEYADRANARSREVEITRATGKRDWYPSILGAFVVLAFTILLCTLIFHPPERVRTDDPGYASYQTQQSLINILIGALTAGFSTVLGYYFGSSVGSRSKDNTIATLSSDAAERPSTPTRPPLVTPLTLPSGSVPRTSWRDK
jgi:hypothetical protein